MKFLVDDDVTKSVTLLFPLSHYSKILLSLHSGPMGIVKIASAAREYDIQGVQQGIIGRWQLHGRDVRGRLGKENSIATDALLLHVRRSFAKSYLTMTTSRQRAQHMCGFRSFSHVLLFSANPIVIRQAIERLLFRTLAAETTDAVPASPRDTVWISNACAWRHLRGYRVDSLRSSASHTIW